jgi:hypothetical protein
MLETYESIIKDLEEINDMYNKQHMENTVCMLELKNQLLKEKLKFQTVQEV